jgi:ATP-dependent RNA helicase DDX51/DBP6
VVTTTELKPLVLFHIVLEHKIRNALVFTKSTESTGRLLRLWESFEAKRLAGTTQNVTEAQSPIVAKAFSSDLTPAQRKSILSDFRNGAVSM